MATRLPALAASRQQAFHAVDADLVTRATPRLVQGVEQLCAALEATRMGLSR